MIDRFLLTVKLVAVWALSLQLTGLSGAAWNQQVAFHWKAFGEGEGAALLPVRSAASRSGKTAETSIQREHGFACTQVIGYSQVGTNQGPHRGWYVAGAGVFESIAGGERWQLLWRGGAGVDQWQNPDYDGWQREIVSPCAAGAETPDRVLLSVSGPFGKDEGAWAEAIEATLRTIRQKIPSARQIILQPVVGGPGDEPCSCTERCGDRAQVRASWQHRHIRKAIERVVEEHASQPNGVEVVAGFSPQVRDCTDYYDGLGHLTPEAAEDVARRIAEYYAQPEG